MGSRGRLHGLSAAAAPPRRFAPRWLAIALAALVSLTFQSFVAETHVHLATRADQAVSAAILDQHHSRPSAPIDCPACRQLASAADLIAAAPVAIPVVAPATAWFGPSIAPTAWRHERSHAWRSRGPPQAGSTSRPPGPRSA